MTKAELQHAGFADSEIENYFAEQREDLSDAGFSQQEISNYYGQQTATLENPDEAYKSGLDIQDMSVEFELPIEDIEGNYDIITETADPKDLPVEPPSEMRFELAPPKTTWSKIKGFFTSERIPLPPNASRMEKVDRAFDTAVGAPLRTFLKFVNGKFFGAGELMWGGVKRIVPDDVWVDEVRNMTLDEAMDWSAGYNPSGFVKMAGDVAGFIGRLQTAKGIGIKTGLLGKTPKDITVLIKAGESAKLFGIAAAAEQVSKAVAEKIDPTETEYGYEGPIAVLRDMAIGAALSIIGSGVKAAWAKLTPSEITRALDTLGLKKGATDKEIKAAAETLFHKYHPDKAKGFIKEFQAVVNARKIVKEGEFKDIVFRGQKVIFKPKLLAEGVTKPVTQPPAVAPVAKVPTKVAKIPPKAPTAKPAVPVKIGKPTEAVTGEVELAKWIRQRAKANEGTVGAPKGDFDAALKKVSEEIQRGEFPDELDRPIIQFLKATKDAETGEIIFPEAADFPRTTTLINFLEGVEAPTPTEVKPKTVPEKIAEPKEIKALVDFETFTKSLPNATEAEIVQAMIEDGLTPPIDILQKHTDLPEVRDILEKKKTRPGFIDVEPLQKTFDAVLDILEPAKLTDIKLGKDVSAIVLRGIHKPDVAMIEFNEKEIDNLDGTLGDFGKKLGQYSNDILETLMLTRGKPGTKAAIAIKNEALVKLKKEAPELIGTRDMITKIADFNYKFLTDVVGDKVEYVTDYFYGIYKDTKKVDRFLDFWKTTKRFTKEKKLPTVADAKAYGLELRDPNPVNNLRSEYMAIARLDGMIWMRDELLRTGEDVYISKNPALIKDAEKIPEPVFKGLWFDPVLANEIKKLISTNKIAKVPALNALRKTNNFLRSIKFTFSAFHHMVIAKQAIADSGYLGFLYKPTATRGFTTGFKASDPIFKTAEYKDYIEHTGGHRYSIDSEAQRAFSSAIQKLTKSGQLAVRGVTAPLRVPEGYVRWLFEKYIPKVKYSKYLDTVNEMQKKLGRELTSAEKIEVVKEGQNFYGMMNEKIFGRSGTVTTVLRLKFMAPGFAEGNYRTMIKAISQWGQEGTWNAGRSRANIVNSLILTAIAATAGTLAFTGKAPKKPETAKDIRDLFKVDTGKVDSRGRRMMIDLLTYDRDYWAVFGKPLVGQAGEVPIEVIRRLGGMTATTFEMISDLNQLSMGKAIYDWKGDRIVEVTDPFLKRAVGLIAHEIQKVEPIATNIYRQARDRNLTRMAAAITTLAGARPTTSEKDKRESQIISRIFSLRDRQERLYHFLGSIKNPRKHINDYNKIAQGVLDNPITTVDMRLKWGKNLVIDTDRLIANKVHSQELLKVSEKPDPDKLERNRKWLTNFDVPESDFRKHLTVYEMKHRKLILEMKAGDADEMLKREIAKFYADKGILNRKVKGETADDKEKRLSRRYDKIADGISTVSTRLHRTVNTADRKRLYERIKSLIERSTE